VRTTGFSNKHQRRKFRKQNTLPEISVHVETLFTFLDGEQFEDTTGGASSRKSKDRQHKGKAKNHKRTNNDL
jgi:hypothetical protein